MSEGIEPLPGQTDVMDLVEEFGPLEESCSE